MTHNRPPLTLDKLIAELDRVAVNTYMAGDQAAAALLWDASATVAQALEQMRLPADAR